MLESPHASVETLLILLLVVFAVALVAQWARLPYTIALVLTGLLGFQPGFQNMRLTPELILTVFLPVLLFEGAYNVPAKALWHNLLPVALLAAPGVLLGMAVTGVFLHFVLALPWMVALLFGALIASTDPIAVISIFRELRTPRRLTLLVEGESLFNDGAAITLFNIMLVAVMASSFSFGEGVLHFVVTVAGALAVGGLIGYGGSRVLTLADNAQVQITATVLAAYGSYLFAERLTFSGAIAVVVTGLFFGNYGAVGGLSLRSVVALGATWDFLGFVANSLIFLEIGIELNPPTLIQYWQSIVLAFLATLLGRAVAVYFLLPWLRGRFAIPPRWRPVLLWGGLRGAVSLALVLSLPFTLPDGSPFPERSALHVMAFGVVGLSLVLQGLTLRPLIARLGIVSARESEGALEAAEARLEAIEGAQRALTREHELGAVGNLHFRRLSQAHALERNRLLEQIQRLRVAEENAPAEERRPQEERRRVERRGRW